MEVGPGIKTGVDIRIDDPAELGADLIATAAAGIAEYGAPLVIINLCTLTTLSVIDSDKHFIGAVFMPGIRHVSYTHLDVYKRQIFRCFQSYNIKNRTLHRKK